MRQNATLGRLKTDHPGERRGELVGAERLGQEFRARHAPRRVAAGRGARHEYDGQMRIGDARPLGDVEAVRTGAQVDIRHKRAEVSMTIEGFESGLGTIYGLHAIADFFQCLTGVAVENKVIFY